MMMLSLSVGAHVLLGGLGSLPMRFGDVEIEIHLRSRFRAGHAAKASRSLLGLVFSCYKVC